MARTAWITLAPVASTRENIRTTAALMEPHRNVDWIHPIGNNFYLDIFSLKELLAGQQCMRRLLLIPPALCVFICLLDGIAVGADPSLDIQAPGPEIAADNVPEEAAPATIDNAQEYEEDAAGEASPGIRDPLEPFNRAVFVFNDKAYFWVMKPVARGYAAVVPEPARVSVRNFFSNITTPIRLVNSLLQGRIRDSGVELLRFAINSTVGIAGLFDAAKNDFQIDKGDEDLGQTLGAWGMGHGLYIVLPLLGPSSLRDAAGLAGDAFLDPVNYLEDLETVIAAKAFKAENEVSLTIGDYEDLKKSAVDPYIAVRDAFVQHRADKVRR
jgi:phospholipid-binding lipoprotein MlaA